MIFVVLGMHKSGTTLVSRILHHSGIDMGEFDENVSYDKGNKYERAATLALDMDILGTDSYEVLGLSGPASKDLGEDQIRRMREIIDDCQGRHVDWGFKDPRACLLYDAWARELPEHKVIVVYRDPAEVWPRFKWTGKRLYHTNFNRASDYLQRWLEHNLNIVEFLENSSVEHLVIEYSALMTTDVEFGKLETFVGRRLDDQRQPGLYRSHARPDIFLRGADWYLETFRNLSCARTLDALAEMRRATTPGVG